MAKEKFNYKKLKINRQELSTTTIGKIDNQEKSPIFLFILFGIFLVFVFYLPSLVTYIENNGKDIISTISGGNTSKEDSNNSNIPQEEIVYYDIANSETYTLEDALEISNIKIANNILSLRITNTTNTKFYFNRYNYFIEIYTSGNMMLERVIMSRDSIARASYKDFEFSVSEATAGSASKITFVKKTVDDYPSVVLNNNNQEQETLVCKNEYETLTYTFNNEKLEEITDVIYYTAIGNELDYQSILSLWQGRVNMYNAINGITSTIMSNIGYFTVNTIVDLKNANVSTVDNTYYYTYETEAKVINFEMEAQGFSCE